MVIDYLILFSYIIISRWIIKKTKVFWLRNILGPFLAGIMIGLMLIGVVQDNFESLFVVAPAFIYLMYISARREQNNKVIK